MKENESITTEQMVRELCLSCQECEYFMRHYIRSSIYLSSINGFTPISRGHCVRPGKGKKPYVGAGDAACSNFKMKEDDEE